jgi:MFS family permease
MKGEAHLKPVRRLYDSDHAFRRECGERRHDVTWEIARYDNGFALSMKSSGAIGLLMPVYVPTALLSFGQGLLIPVLPLYAKQAGGSFGLAGLIVSAAWIGTMLSDLPSGLLLPKFGFRRSMIAGAALFSVATILLGLVSSTPELIVLQFVGGIGTAFWGLSRHAYIATAIPNQTRGRAISVFGGINRLGTFTGPFAGGFIAQYYGLGNAIVVAGIAAGFAVVVAFFSVHDPESSTVKPKGHAFHLDVVREAIDYNRRDVIAAGTANVFGQMIRAGRQIAIPLFAAYALGLDNAQVGIIVGASALLDMSLFIPAGYVMDRFGRKAASVPSFAILALGMAMVPFTHSYAQLMIAGLVMGLGNGMGAGSMMTLGADLAPPHLTGEFLGIWRLIGDSGRAISPIIVGAVADAVGIVVTTGAIAGLGVIAAATLATFVRETRWDAERRAKPAAKPAERPGST